MPLLNKMDELNSLMKELRRRELLEDGDIREMREHFIKAQNARETITTEDIRQMRKQATERHPEIHPERPPETQQGPKKKKTKPVE